MSTPTKVPGALGLTTSEAARYLGCSLSTVRRWDSLGYLHALRTPGGQRRFARAELDRFIADLDVSDTMASTAASDTATISSDLPPVSSGTFIQTGPDSAELA